MLACARVLSLIRPRVLASLRATRTPVSATRAAKLVNRVVLLTRSFRLREELLWATNPLPGTSEDLSPSGD
jgi:hypothetical protein